NDIRFSRGRVYTMGDNKIAIYDKYGELLRSGSCSFGGVRIAVTGSNTVCVINDSQMEETAVKKG
ncbi:MAG: hypothetical protein IK086_05780, partial [Clostridia bacterium]|nr:hypothetical protein [Clostridia bacterium]